MMQSVFSGALCASCRNCCVFEKQSAWEFPTFSVKTAARLAERQEYICKEENGRVRISMPYDKTGAAQHCPFLDPDSGCTLPADEKPFACSLWPIRLMKMPDGSIAPTVYRSCPGVPPETYDKLRTLLRDGLLDRIIQEAEKDPSILLPYHANYMPLLPDYPQPEAVFRYFSAVAAIPHGSGNTAALRAWCMKTAENLGVHAEEDAAGNVMIRKNGSPGYENHPGVILQGHLDMVCAAEAGCTKDMEHEPVSLLWQGDTLTADGTTLGGDDGIAIAYAFAVLEANNIQHPPLTVILTADEETGMNGAEGLSPDALTGNMLINIDSEDEGVFTVGCAGGVRVHLHLPVQQNEFAGTGIRITIANLRGGHSGSEIHRPHLNANLVMARLLCNAGNRISLCELIGGVRDNVIPTDCTALLYSDMDFDSVRSQLETELQKIRQECPEESGISLTIKPENGTKLAVSSEDTGRILDLLNRLPNGVQSLNETLGLPQTSLNLGTLRLTETELTADTLVRSSSNAEKAALAEKLHQLCAEAGGTSEESGSYPAWEYQPGTELEKTAVRVFTEMYGKAPIVETIHAGLECGLLAAKKPGLECISIGPDLKDIHTPRETLSIPSAARTWKFLLALLKAL